MTFVYIIIALVILIVILSMIAPKDYAVERSIVIDKPVSVVFEYLKYLKNQDEWSPWAAKDPNMKKEFVGTDGMPGFVSKWEGNKDVGSGEQEVTHIIDNKRIDSQLRFLKPFKSTSDAYMAVEPAGDDQTKVDWGFTGHNKFPVSIMMLFMNMDKMVGPDFEMGLDRLKRKLES